jgi:hypothetical protein
MLEDSGQADAEFEITKEMIKAAADVVEGLTETSPNNCESYAELILEAAFAARLQNKPDISGSIIR